MNITTETTHKSVSKRRSRTTFLWSSVCCGQFIDLNRTHKAAITVQRPNNNNAMEYFRWNKKPTLIALETQNNKYFTRKKQDILTSCTFSWYAQKWRHMSGNLTRKWKKQSSTVQRSKRYPKQRMKCIYWGCALNAIAYLKNSLMRCIFSREKQNYAN